MPSQAQLRESITRQIVEALESGGLPPWRRPWFNDPAAGPACNVISRKKYRGINPLLLAVASMRHNLQSKYWGTWNQWKELGGHVMKRPDNVPPGEWGTNIIFWSKVTKTEENDDGEEEKRGHFLHEDVHGVLPRSGRGTPPGQPAGRPHGQQRQPRGHL
jgi:antirestriction protein ArdC